MAMKTNATPMKFLALFSLVLVLGAFQPASPDQTETIYLEGRIGRAPLTAEAPELLVQICGLKPGIAYDLMVVAVTGPQLWQIDHLSPTGFQQGKGGKLKLEADQACDWVKISISEKAFKSPVPLYLSYRGQQDDLQGDQKLLSPIVTDDTAPVDSLIQNSFIGGDCFEVFNIVSQGESTSIGSFFNGATSIGFDEGIILASGDIDIATGPNDQANASSGNLSGAGGDPDLNALANFDIFDVTIVEFDFVPTVDTIQFEYVFASEEYCEWVGSIFNDVFGFFISGPGISGPFSNGAINIAQVPGIGDPVAVNNINHQINTQYYVGNIPPGSSQLFDPDCAGHPTTTGPSVDDCQYDGFTTALTATAAVIPCSTYHIKLAIADVGDGSFDAAVFLKANSFNAGASAVAQAVGTPDSINVIAEGCSEGYFEFTRTTPDTTEALEVTFTVLPASTATPVDDYVPLPTSITIPAGQMSVQLPVEVVDDLIAEGTESILLALDVPCLCSDPVIEMFIEDRPTVEVLLDDMIICSTDTIALAPAPSGGIGEYSYLWSTGDTTAVLLFAPTAGGLDTLSVIVTDACGNMASDTALILAEEGPTAELTGDGGICGADSVTLFVHFTGQGPWVFAYALDGAAQALLATDDNPYELVVSTEGLYTLTSVGDLSACPGAVSGEVVVTAGELATDLLVNSISCNGSADGSILVSVTGGTEPYSFEWESGETTDLLEDLGPGTYIVSITDQSGCSAVDTVLLTEPAALTLDFSIDSILCFGDATGGISAFVDGGTPPYTYLWNTGDDEAILTDLPAGAYDLVVTDSLGCTVEGTVTLSQPDELIVAVDASPASCSGGADGSAVATISGGVEPYAIEWSMGGTSGTELDDLAAGDYMLTATDANGCKAETTFSVGEPDPLEASATIEAVPCGADETGEINLSVSGGAEPYEISWDTGDMGAVLSGIPAGVYEYTVTDANDCVLTGIIELESNIAPDLAAELLSNSCFDGATGSAQVLISGGEPPYEIEWSTGATTEIADGLAAGDYSATVVDANGCTAVAVVTVGEEPPLECVAVVVNPISSYNGSDGVVSAEITSGEGPFAFLWSTGDNDQEVSGLPAGTYDVTVTDGNGCESFCSVTLDNPSQIGDRVWEDKNENGQQDPGETGLGNILVTLVGLDAAGNPMLLTTTTAADGSYLFDGLPAATFTLTFGDLPLDYVFSPANVGNDATDSDVISTDGSTGSISIGLNESRLTIDAGLFNACDNITFPGTIAGDEYLCGPGNDPGPIVEVLPASGGSGPIEYMWMMSTQGGPFNANTWTPIPNSNTPNYNPGPIAVTTYYARCVRRDGCTLFLEGNIVVKEVGSEAVAVINGPATICVDDIVTFSADDSGAGATYNWNFGQNASPPTASTQSVDVSWSLYGVQTITLSATNNGCTSTASMQVYVTNSPNWCDQNLQGSDRSSTKEALGQVRLFPNPTADLLNVQLPPDLEGPVRLELFSTTGQRLQTYFLEGPATETLDLSTLQPGLYLLNCTFANAEPQMLRVMKQGE